MHLWCDWDEGGPSQRVSFLSDLLRGLRRVYSWGRLPEEYGQNRQGDLFSTVGVRWKEAKDCG